ncbi:MAG TPA: tetratricopeptide repeat protein [Myxococcota bacterium]|nr:tetratricopeptide repeat protein [Myxococcota bacterium]
MSSFALYAPTLHYAFVNWDDHVYVLENPWIRSLSLVHLQAIFGNEYLNNYLPLHLLSYLFDYLLWELDPFGYHLHSVLLNAANGVLAWALIAQLTRRRDVALVAALLFTVHQSHVEAVAWVSARKEILFTTFLLLSALAYQRARRDGQLHRWAFAGSIALFGLGMLSKTTIAAYPLFFLVMDFVLDAQLPAERRRPLAFHLATKLPYLAIAAVLTGVNLHVQVTASDPLSAHPLTYTLVKGQAGWRYFWLLLGLLPGQPIYDPPPISLDALVAALTVLPLVAPVLLLAIALRRGQWNAALALCWLIAGLVPPLAFPLITYMADRYLYAPSLGFCWLIAIAIARIADGARSPAWRLTVLAVFTAVPALWYTQRAWAYMPVWRDSEALWTYASANSRDGRAATALARIYREQGRLDEAARLLEKTEVPGPQGYLNLLGIYAIQGRLDAALRTSDLALDALAKDGADAKTASDIHAARGAVLMKLERRDEAIAEWQRALAIDPNNGTARELLERERTGAS